MNLHRGRQSKIMQYFSTLAGPLRKFDDSSDASVEFVDVHANDSVFYRLWVRVVAYTAFILVLSFAAVLFHPTHWLITQQPDSSIFNANFAMLVCLVLLQIFAIVGTLSSTRATLKAKNPIPLEVPRGLRVAFVTTRAPGEPIDMVRKTLKAIKGVQYSEGFVDAWLLDETKDPELRALCNRMHVRYFSRQGVERWNTPKPKKSFRSTFIRLVTWGVIKDQSADSHDPFFAARSKHGNFNAWRSYLKEKGIVYDILAGVDTDHVPEPNYLQRVLGYFHDQDVAYVVGPQVYGNYRSGLEGVVARWSESQASFFQSTIQRAANHGSCAMFVGTNYAIRMSVLDQIGGIQPCITEDMATGLAVHSSRNPKTGVRWKSVYTPDVLAVGEGPDNWGPFFTQQWRWAAGAFDTWRRSVWKVFFKLSPKAMVHYFLILTFYPMAALSWIIAIISSLLYLTTGATAVLAPWGQFVSLYLMTLVMQLSLYFWNRRHNVSPHEPAGSYGVSGMAMSTLTAPIYFSALMGIVLGKKPHFVVTTKGGGATLDRLPAFKLHVQWAVVLIIAVAYGALVGNDHPAMLVWVAVLLLTCVTPLLLFAALVLKTHADAIHRILFMPITLKGLRRAAE